MASNGIRMAGAAVLLALMLLPVLMFSSASSAEDNSYDTDEHHKFTVIFDIPDVANCDHYLIEFGDGETIDSLVDDTSSVSSTYHSGSDTWDYRVVHTYPEVTGIYTMEFTAISDSGHTATNGLNVRLLGYPVISFETNGGSPIDDITVPNGPGNGGTQADKFYTRASAPADPVKEGSVFAGWFTDSGLTHVWDWNYLVTEDTTLYAAWDLPTEECRITFYVDRVPYSELVLEKGDVITLPADPVKEGYRFLGWKGYSTGMTAESDRGFCAQWESVSPVTFAVSYTVSGKAYSVYIPAGSTIDFVPPVRDGYTFDGWYADEGCTVSMDGAAVSSDMTIYPKYMEDSEKSPGLGWSFGSIILALIGVCITAVGCRAESRMMIVSGLGVFASGVAVLGAGMFGVI